MADRWEVSFLLVACGATAALTVFTVIEAVALDWSMWAPAAGCFIGALVLVGVAAGIRWKATRRPATAEADADGAG